MINTWINAFLKPKETFAKEKANASLGKGVISYLIAGLISGVLGFVLSMAFASLMPFGTPNAGVFGIVTAPIGAIIGSLIGAGIIFIIAKVLGGNGSYTSLYYLASLYAVPVAVLGWIPLVGFLVSLYSLYLLVLALKESMQMTTGKAVLAVLIPIIVIAIIVAIMVVILGAALLTMFGALGAPTGYFGLA